jgi:excisionase family DNA binding protein
MNGNRKYRRTANAVQRRGVEPTNDNILAVFTTSEAAEHVRLGKPTLERLRLIGGGPVFVRLGRAVRYRRVDLDDWLESRRVHSTSEVVR